MKELLRKEFRTLSPFVALYLFLTLASRLLGPMDPVFPDLPRADLEKFFDELMDELVWDSLFFAVLMAAGLLINEEENGTLDFLDGLPLHRGSVFAAKWMAASMILGLVLVTDWGIAVGALHLSWESTSPQFPWADLFASLLLGCLAGGLFLGISLCLSFLRNWFLLGVGTAALGLIWLEVSQSPFAAWVSPFRLSALSQVRAGISIPWGPTAVQALLGILATVLAAIGFLRLGRTTASKPSDEPVRMNFHARLLRVLYWIPFTGVIVGLVVGLGKLAERDDSGRSKVSPEGEQEFERRQSEHFQFVMWRADRAKASSLLAGADKAYAKVAELLGAASRKDKIVVDLASRARPEVLGHAHWKKIHVERRTLDTDQALATLGHETVHVLLEELSQGGASRHFGLTQFFHEGLATHVEHRFFLSASDQAAAELTAAAAHSWEPIEFDLLSDDARWNRRRDAGLVYPLGALWCEALVASSGEEAIGRIGRALAQKSLPHGDAGEFWRTVLQHAGQDLENVNAAFHRRLAGLVATNSTLLASLPRLRCLARSESPILEIQVSHEGAPPGTLILAVSRDPAAGLFGTETAFSPGAGRFQVNRLNYPGNALWVAPGWQLRTTNGLPFQVQEPWSQVDVEAEK